MLIFVMLLLFVLSLLLLSGGLRLIVAPLDTLWANREKTLLTRGIPSERSAAWEKQVYLRGAFCVVTGIICFALAFLSLMGVIKTAKHSPAGLTGAAQKVSPARPDR